MIKIHVLVFLVVLQLLLIFIGLSVYLFLTRKKTTNEQTEAPARTPPPNPTPSMETYLNSELASTQKQQKQQQEGSDAYRQLALRAAYLQLEAQWSKRPERGDDFWANIQEPLRVLLKSHQPPGDQDEVNIADDNGEANMQLLLDNQNKTIDYLKRQIANMGLEAEVTKEIQSQVDKLGQTNRELTYCVAILEDENGFLRNQIKTLFSDG